LDSARRLQDHGIELSDNLEVVGYDAMPLTSVLYPNITSVDQNLVELASCAVKLAESLLDGESVELVTEVDPKIITANQDKTTQENLYLSAAVDQDEISDRAYMSTLVNNSFVWADELSESSIDDIMSLSPVYERHMQLACFSRILNSKDGRRLIKLSKIYTLSGVEEVIELDANTTCELGNFPPTRLVPKIPESADLHTHFFVRVKGQLWGVITTFGGPFCATELSSYLHMAGQIDAAAKVVGLQLSLSE